MGRVVVLNGPSSAGKTTVEYAATLDTSAASLEACVARVCALLDR